MLSSSNEVLISLMISLSYNVVPSQKQSRSECLRNSISQVVAIRVTRCRWDFALHEKRRDTAIYQSLGTFHTDVVLGLGALPTYDIPRVCPVSALTHPQQCACWMGIGSTISKFLPRCINPSRSDGLVIYTGFPETLANNQRGKLSKVPPIVRTLAVHLLPKLGCWA
jgi:hypothetical protein